MPRVLSAALLLVLLVGATSLTQRVMHSLPGTFFYPIKNVGEQGVGVLMQAAGEEIPWHATQAEARLQELSQLSQPDAATTQALVNVIEEHWESVLTATQRLPVAERIAVLQARLTRLQQIEADWASPQTATSPVAVLTVRKMIGAGEQLLAASQSVETAATSVPTAIPTTIPTIPSTATRIPTATPLLQATLTLPRSPILVGTATSEATPVDLSIPATELPSPTLLATVPPAATPIPVMTAQMPLQQSNSQESSTQASNRQESDSGSDSSNEDEDKNNSTESDTTLSGPVTNQENSLTLEATDSPLAGEATLQTPEAGVTIDATVIATLEPPVGPTVATLAVTPVIGEPPTTPVENTEEPVETEVSPVDATDENTSPTSGKGTPSAPATPELLATETPRPTNQPTATKTPKSTATPIEKTPKPTAQPTSQPLETLPPTSTPSISSQSVTSRPTSPSNEATKIPQP